MCTWFAQEKPAKVVYGPGTFINTAAGQIAEGFSGQAGGQGAARPRPPPRPRDGCRSSAATRRPSRSASPSQARSLVYAQFTEDTLRLALRYGLTSIPSLDNVDFVSQLVFDPSRGVGEPKARFAYLFPSNDAALIQVRLRPDLSDAERERGDRQDPGGRRARAVRARPRRPVLRDRRPRRGGRLASAVRDSIFILLGAALLVMAATLRSSSAPRLRLLPLALALGAAALTFGAFSVAGASLTMASIAALPVLIGLAVDYASSSRRASRR